MTYLYYPGCSLEGSAREYDGSTRAVMEQLGIQLLEIDGWTCCGATAAEAMNRLLSLCLSARNLALAERMETGFDILAPCSACYLNLKKAGYCHTSCMEDRTSVNTALEAEDLVLKNPPPVRHLLDVLFRDVTPAGVSRQVKRPLEGLVLAPYYGCQAIRPFAEFDDPEKPKSMHRLIEACGAESLSWDLDVHCCGASNMNTKPETAKNLVAAILEDAGNAHAIVTVCPMCQLNLEGFQAKVSRMHGRDLSISVLYLPQVIGLAFGLSPKEVMLEKNIALTPEVKQRLMAS